MHRPRDELLAHAGLHHDEHCEIGFRDELDVLPEALHHLGGADHVAPLTQLVDLAVKLEEVHADKSDCPTGLAKLLADIQTAVESPLAKEEQILFPLIIAGRGQTTHMPVQVMLHEHDDHGRNLRRIRELTYDFRLPKDACASWRELYRALAELETELMAHIHLENNILFPWALAE